MGIIGKNMIERKQLMSAIFDVLANKGKESRNHYTQEEFCEKWDFEIDYTNNILTFWEEEDNDLNEEDREYYHIIVD